MLRKLAIALLHDDYGITESAWTILWDMLIEDEERHERKNGHDDIIKAVKGCDGRIFLPPGWKE